MGERCGDVQALSPPDRLLRRVYDDPDSLEFVPDEGRWVPKGAPPAVQFDRDLSMSWREHLKRRHRLGPEAAIAGGRHALVFEITVRDAEGVGCTAEHTPIDTEPVGCAHSSVWYPVLPDGLTRRERKSHEATVRSVVGRAMRLVHGSVTQAPPPGA